MHRTEQADGPSRRDTSSLFDQAAQVFDGWTDPDTGVRVLHLWPPHLPRIPGRWTTFYHQYNPFLDGGRTVLLQRRDKLADNDPYTTDALDLTTGRMEGFGRVGYHVTEVWDATRMATMCVRNEEDASRGILWDMRAEKEVASVSLPGWALNSLNFTSDGQRAFAFFFRGRPYKEQVQSRHYLLTPGEEPQLLMEADGYFCSHIQSCPTDVNLYTYDRWPSPKRDIEQSITIRTLDGSFEEPVKLDENAPRPADMWGCRDHYVWAPDGSRIISYLCTHPIEFELSPGFPFNHFNWQWWLSALDWRTGEDYAAPYPPGRWGGHMQMTPDSRYIICGGGPGFDKLFAVNVADLRAGWNEHIICSYPETVSVGKNSDPFPYPWVLPDSSGVIFSAGWPGPEHGIYLAEWPQGLQ